MSSFNWSIVPGPITITPTPVSEAIPGEIILDSNLLDSGEFSWGVVQHQYAHQVDFALLDDTMHAQLNAALGGTVWCYADSPTPLMHDQYGCERFASTLARAYWQSPENCMKPSYIAGESGGISPAAFRALITTLLGTITQEPPSTTPRQAVTGSTSPTSTLSATTVPRVELAPKPKPRHR